MKDNLTIVLIRRISFRCKHRPCL